MASHTFPVNRRPELLDILLFTPHSVAGAHPRMLVDRDTQKWVEVLAPSQNITLNRR